jgi:hypothetical protein
VPIGDVRGGGGDVAAAGRGVERVDAVLDLPHQKRAFLVVAVERVFKHVRFNEDAVAPFQLENVLDDFVRDAVEHERVVAIPTDPLVEVVPTDLDVVGLEPRDPRHGPAAEEVDARRFDVVADDLPRPGPL